MVHNAFSESLLNGACVRIPHLKVINIPIDVSTKSIALQTEHLQNVLQAHGLEYASIDFFIVESNYGAPTSVDINGPLLSHILQHFQNAKIIAFSNTYESLAKAVQFDPRIGAYSIRALKKAVADQHVLLSAQDSTNLFPDNILEGDASRNTLPILTLFSTSLAASTTSALAERSKASGAEKSKTSGADRHHSNQHNSPS